MPRGLPKGHMRLTIDPVSVADDPSVRELIALAKREDLGRGDITTALLDDPHAPSAFELQVKSAGVLAGREVLPAILSAYDPQIRVEWAAGTCDGMKIGTPPMTIAALRGALGSVLAAERVLLNFLQRLCGVATLTRAFVDAVSGTRAAVYDTRKTTPGWRILEKYAVRCGGGHNHRMGLYDAVLIKDNHLVGADRGRLASAVVEMLNRLPARDSGGPEVSVEAQSVREVEQLLKVVGIDVILLDNFAVPDLAKAVGLRDAAGLEGKVALEASGGITLRTVRAVAETGVDRISVGALTHSAPALDLSLERI